MSNLVNLTPHQVTFQAPDGTRTTLDPRADAKGDPNPARVSQAPGPMLGYINGIPTYGPSAMGAVVGLPDPAEGTVYVVSIMVRQALGVTRTADVVAPGTGPMDRPIRFPPGHPQAGHIDAVTRFVMG
jgi:hypothetical protein